MDEIVNKIILINFHDIIEHCVMDNVAYRIN